MKTKYVKVPVDKNEMYNEYQRANIGNDVYEAGAYMSGFEDSERQFKEVPDHSEDMLSMLERIRINLLFSTEKGFDKPFSQEEIIKMCDEMEGLINKVKNEV